MNAEFTHLRILVSDYPNSLRFYRDILQLPLVSGDETTGYCEFLTGGVRLALFQTDEMARVVGTSGRPQLSGSQDRAVIIFRVDSVDETCRELEARGVSLLTSPEDRPDWGIRTAHFRDPDSNLIEVNSKL